MPRISRFLFANWLNEHGNTIVRKNNSKLFVSSSYMCFFGKHQREILVSNDCKKWEITDKVKGFKKHAIIRWNLYGDNWELKNNIVKSDSVLISIFCESNNFKLMLDKGWCSKKYYKKEKITTLKVIVESEPSTVKTIIKV